MPGRTEKQKERGKERDRERLDRERIADAGTYTETQLQSSFGSRRLINTTLSKGGGRRREKKL
jgi:hypothetical protein